MNRTEALVLRLFAAWTVWVWGTRIWNILRDPDPAHGVAFKAVHVVLAVVSVGFAVAAWRIVTAVRRRRSTAGMPDDDQYARAT
ncbi:MAG TPA: hypothetical protein VHN98_04230 [Acidimicrobiales bacterium]|nr:hypothetical protein [Acidimicrobiales bacterium]